MVDKSICDVPPNLRVSTITLLCSINKDIVNEEQNVFLINNILKYLELDENNIIQLKSGNVIRELQGFKKLTHKKKKETKKREKEGFYNQISIKSIISKENLKIVNIKLFSNGSIEITGCQNLNHINTSLNLLITTFTLEKQFINTKRNLMLDDIVKLETHMINADFNSNFRINRNCCFQLLQSQVKCIFFPQFHPSVRVILEIEKNNTSKVFIFESGRILISAKNSKSLRIGYSFILKFLFDNYKTIKINIIETPLEITKKKIEELELEETKKWNEQQIIKLTDEKSEWMCDETTNNEIEKLDETEKWNEQQIIKLTNNESEWTTEKTTNGET